MLAPPPHFLSQVLNSWHDWSSCINVLRSHGDSIIFGRLHLCLVRSDATRSEYRWNDDNAKISQFDGRRILHGWSRSNVTNVLLFGLDVSFVSWFAGFVYYSVFVLDARFGLGSR